MATIHDQRVFDSAVALAQAGHQNAIAAAQSAFNAAREQATRDWQDRLGAAKAKFDAVKSHAVLGDETAVIRRELGAVRPDIEPVRQKLARDVEAADAALNETLAAVRRKLFTPPAGDNVRPIRAAS